MVNQMLCFPYALQIHYSLPLGHQLAGNKCSVRETTFGDTLDMSGDGESVTKTWQQKEIMSDSTMALVRQMTQHFGLRLHVACQLWSSSWNYHLSGWIIVRGIRCPQSSRLIGKWQVQRFLWRTGLGTVLVTSGLGRAASWVSSQQCGLAMASDHVVWPGGWGRGFSHVE